MLSTEQVHRFVDDGFVRVESAFPLDVARRCTDEIQPPLLPVGPIDFGDEHPSPVAAAVLGGAARRGQLPSQMSSNPPESEDVSPSVG